MTLAGLPGADQAAAPGRLRRPLRQAEHDGRPDGQEAQRQALSVPAAIFRPPAAERYVWRVTSGVSRACPLRRVPAMGVRRPWRCPHPQGLAVCLTAEGAARLTPC